MFARLILDLWKENCFIFLLDLGIILLAPAKFTFKKYNLLHILKESAKNPYIYTHTYTMYVYTYIHTCIDNLYLILTEKVLK